MIYLGGAVDYASHLTHKEQWQHWPEWDEFGPYCPKCQCTGLTDDQIIVKNRSALLAAPICILDLREKSIGTPIEMYWRVWEEKLPAILISAPGSVFVRWTAANFPGVTVVASPGEAWWKARLASAPQDTGLRAKGPLESTVGLTREAETPGSARWVAAQPGYLRPAETEPEFSHGDPCPLCTSTSPHTHDPLRFGCVKRVYGKDGYSACGIPLVIHDPARYGHLYQEPESSVDWRVSRGPCD